MVQIAWGDDTQVQIGSHNQDPVMLHVHSMDLINQVQFGQLARALHRHVVLLREGCLVAPLQVHDPREALLMLLMRSEALDVHGASCPSNCAGRLAVGRSVQAPRRSVPGATLKRTPGMKMQVAQRILQGEAVLTLSSSNFSHCLPSGRMKV